MAHYVVTWVIDVEADNPEQAAREARRRQENTEGIAHVYNVRHYRSGKCTTVDLDELEGKETT